MVINATSYGVILMTLKLCTLTGADDNTSISQLVEISEKYPFVEWGIMYHSTYTRSYEGIHRYPSARWIHQFLNEAPYIKKSLHLCGSLAIDTFMNTKELDRLCSDFGRVQINQSRLLEIFSEDVIRTRVNSMKPIEIIFQYNDHGRGLDKIIASQTNCSFLFDASRGAGILPENWQTPFYGFSCGYAGGLSPENLELQLSLIEKAALGNEYWIDMETKVRTENQFDMKKINQVTEIMQKYIAKNEKGLQEQSFPEGDMSYLFVKAPPG